MGSAAVLENPNSLTRPISPFRELGAYEALWAEQKTSFRTIAERFGKRPGAVPSDFVPEAEALRYAVRVRDILAHAGVEEVKERLRKRHVVEHRHFVPLTHRQSAGFRQARSDLRKAAGDGGGEGTPVAGWLGTRCAPAARANAGSRSGGQLQPQS